MNRTSIRMMPISAFALLMSTALTSAQTMDKLLADAKAEGQLTVIALPHDWCGYGAVIDGFKSKYGLKVNELNPDAGSGDEVEAIKANKGNKGPQAPDVIDVGLSFGPTAKKDGLVQPYKVSTWSTIPDSAKDAEGYWTGDYYGVLTFEVNADLVKKIPSDWPDLLTADYKNSVALAGDPRVSSQAIQAVFAAGLSGAKGDVAKAGEEGLKYFAALNKNGNFVPTIGKAASVAQGATPIVVRWDYNALADRDTLKGNPKIEVVVPKTGVVAGVYVQAMLAQGLLPPDPLPGPGEEQEGAGRRAGEAAAGGFLREGRVSHARPAIGFEQRHYQAVGHRGRREREVSGLSLEVSPGMLARSASLAALPLFPRDPPLPSRQGRAATRSCR